ncbi:MAG TPA: hypothetical protein VGM88_27960 [Kofleriaceae bacterium]|jgi:hypothetical protein
MKQLDFGLVAKRLRFRASSGTMRGDGSQAEHKYVRRCSARAGSTTLVFTRDAGNHEFGWLADPTHDRCWHLSIASEDDTERDAWLRAFFGDRVSDLWAQTCATQYGHDRGVSHWRLFCDERWNPLPEVNADDLLAADLHSARVLRVAVAALAA